MSEISKYSAMNILTDTKDFQAEINSFGGFYDKVHPICKACGGSGLGNDCPSCGGDGCDRCNSGVLACAECGGHGRKGFS